MCLLYWENGRGEKIRRERKVQYIDGEASSWKPGLGAVNATIDFAKTGRFKFDVQAR